MNVWSEEYLFITQDQEMKDLKSWWAYRPLGISAPFKVPSRTDSAEECDRKGQSLYKLLASSLCELQ